LARGRHLAGQATSAPVRILVSNVRLEALPGLLLQGPVGAAVEVQARETLDATTPWVTFTHLVLARRAGRASCSSLDLDPALLPQHAPGTAGIAWFNAWTYPEPAGSRHRIEYVEGEEWTDWQVLADLTLPTSSYQFVDYDSGGRPPRHYEPRRCRELRECSLHGRAGLPGRRSWRRARGRALPRPEGYAGNHPGAPSGREVRTGRATQLACWKCTRRG